VHSQNYEKMHEDRVKMWINLECNYRNYHERRCRIKKFGSLTVNIYQLQSKAVNRKWKPCWVRSKSNYIDISARLRIKILLGRMDRETLVSLWPNTVSNSSSFILKYNFCKALDSIWVKIYLMRFINFKVFFLYEK